ncbi:unnamed protein product, partial [Iphiclides podalirius]
MFPFQDGGKNSTTVARDISVRCLALVRRMSPPTRSGVRVENRLWRVRNRAMLAWVWVDGNPTTLLIAPDFCRPAARRWRTRPSCRPPRTSGNDAYTCAAWTSDAPITPTRDNRPYAPRH